MDKYPNINILLNLDSVFIPKAEFVLRTYCYILRLNPHFSYGSHFEGTHLYYGKVSRFTYPISIYHDPETAAFFESKELYPLDKVNFCKYKGEHIPFLFSQGGAIFSFSEDHCQIRKDIIASGFYFLTCWNEYLLTYHGLPKGRVDFKQSLQYRWSFTEIPVVDVYCQMLIYTMQLFTPEFIRDIGWGDGKYFALSLSHDIDYWNFWSNKAIRQVLLYNLRSFFVRPFNSVYKSIGHMLHKYLFYNNFRQLRNIARKESDMGVSSSWFLLSSAEFEDERQNYINDIVYREQIIDLLGEKEVGLHGSPNSAFNSAILKQELEKLRELGFDPIGFRTHYLNFDYQTSFTILEDAGIKYDSTLGYWENIGFRAGISFPFHPFNIKENRPFRILEIPLIIMDTTLHSKKAMNLSLISSERAIRRLIDLAAKYQSHLSILWHNNTFDPVDYPGWSSLYWRTIRYALKKNGLVCALSKIYNEWVNISY